MVLAVSTISYTAVVWLIGYWTAVIIHTINATPRSDQRVVYPPPYAIEVVEEEDLEAYVAVDRDRGRNPSKPSPTLPRERDPVSTKPCVPRKASPPNFGSRGRMPYGTKVYGM